MRLAQAYMFDGKSGVSRCIHGSVDSVADDVVAYLLMGETLREFTVDKVGSFTAVDILG